MAEDEPEKNEKKSSTKKKKFSISSFRFELLL